MNFICKLKFYVEILGNFIENYTKMCETEAHVHHDTEFPILCIKLLCNFRRILASKHYRETIAMASFFKFFMTSVCPPILTQDRKMLEIESYKSPKYVRVR